MNLLTLNDDCLSLILGRLDEASRFMLRFVCIKISKTKVVNKKIVLQAAIRLGELPLLQFLQELKFIFNAECLKYFVSDNLETLMWLVNLCDCDALEAVFHCITFKSSRVCDEYLMNMCEYRGLLIETKILLFEKYDDWIREDDVSKDIQISGVVLARLIIA